MLGDTFYVRNSRRPREVAFLFVLCISRYAMFSSGCQIVDTNDDICHVFPSYRSAKPLHCRVCSAISASFHSSSRRMSKLREYRCLEREISIYARLKVSIQIRRFMLYSLSLFDLPSFSRRVKFPIYFV